MSETYEGVFAALTAPFSGEEISVEKFRDNIIRYNSFELAGYVVLGSTGESVHLSDDESERLVRTAVEARSSGKKIIVGTARESTRATLEFTNRMAALGVDAALIRTPSYFKSRMDDEALTKHYLTIADRSGIPVFIYHIPGNTGISIGPELLCKLSSHPNIAGIKDSSGNLDFLGEVIPLLPSRFHFLLGAGSVFLQGLFLGARGGILALAAAVPGKCVRLYELFVKKKLDEALKLQLKLIPLNKAIIQTFGIPGLKYALDRLGYYGGPPRLPLLPLHQKGQKVMDKILSQLGLVKN